MSRPAYARGLHELGDGVFAYLQPDGSWGWSNAGLVAGEGTSILIDTLFDLRLTREMLDAMRAVTDSRPIDALLNTHANGDHCWGNQLVGDQATVYASAAAREEMQEVPPQLLHTLKVTDLGPDLNAFVARAFGPFEFGDVELRLPDESFAGRLAVTVGGRTLEFIEVGPAHTAGDVIAHVPDAGTVFTGDILFVENTPIMWAGPVANWLAACDLVCDLDASTLVPGHGPVCGPDGPRTLQRYLRFVQDEASRRFEAGMDPLEAAFDIDLGEWADVPDPERIVVNVDTVYRELDPGRPAASPVDLFAGMARHRAGGAAR